LELEILISIVVAISLFLLFSLFTVLFIGAYFKRRQQHTKEMTEVQYNYEQALLRSQLEIQEETLRHISQEIHDNIGQVLSLAKLQLNTLPAPPASENQEAFAITKQLVSKAITDLRSLSKSLHPDRVNELGLAENIRQELEMLQKSRLYQTHLQINGHVYNIPLQTQTILFRMVQEAISNIIKHANANSVVIILDYESTQFCLTITDNGIGIDVHTAVELTHGIGIRNMQNRSGIIGATFELLPVAGGGTSVQIRLPINNN
jgi:two-component system, NarL family, sensor kinase